MMETLDLMTATSVQLIARESSPFSLHQEDCILFQSFLVGTHLCCVACFSHTLVLYYVLECHMH